MSEPLQKEPEEPEEFGVKSKLGIRYPNELRRDNFVADRAALERVMYIDQDGLLMQDFTITVDEMPIGGGQWSFKKKSTRDEYIRLMDEHWKELCVDFKDAIRQAGYYHLIKEKTPDEDNATFLRAYLHHLQQPLLEQRFDDDEPAKDTKTQAEILNLIKVKRPSPTKKPKSKPSAGAEGKDESNSDDAEPANDDPLTTISDRLHAMRCAGEVNDYKLDRFEQFIMDAESQMQRVRNAYNDDGREEGLQLTAGGPEEGEDWRSESDDNEAHDPEAWRGDIHVRDETSYADSEDEEPSAWEESDDPDEERETDADMAMLKMSAAVERFTYAANKIWTDAAAMIHRGTKLQQNAEMIKSMETFRDETRKAYGEFCDAVDGSAMSQYELKPVFELFEDEKEGPIAKMQKAIDMASKPAMLEAVIKKDMTKQRIKDERSGP